MRTHFYACVLALAGAWPALADGPATLKQARQRWLHGNYDEARTLYQELAKDAKTRTAANIGLSRAWQSEGEYDKAQGVLDAALKEDLKSADLLARQAELYYVRGRWEEAEKTAEGALALSKDHFLARWIR